MRFWSFWWQLEQYCCCYSVWTIEGFLIKLDAEHVFAFCLNFPCSGLHPTAFCEILKQVVSIYSKSTFTFQGTWNFPGINLISWIWMKMIISSQQLILNMRHGKHSKKLCQTILKVMVIICCLWLAATLSSGDILGLFSDKDKMAPHAMVACWQTHFSLYTEC